MERLENPTPSPDGRWIVFTCKTWDKEANKTTTNLSLVSIDGRTTRQLTSAKHQADISPAWSPDGRTVAFVSDRGGSQQIWTIHVDGGEARQLAKFPMDVGNLRWSPTGRHIAFSAEVYPDAKDFDATAKRDTEKAKNPVKAMRFDRLFIRHWDKWFEGKRNHLFVLQVKKRETSDWVVDGSPVDLMKSIDGDCPTKPFGGREDYAWSPDGMEIAYTTQIGRDEAWSTDLNIYLVPITGSPSHCITSDNKAIDAQPVYSPDGRFIAYLATKRPGFEADRRLIRLYDRISGKIRTLTEPWDHSPDAITWSGDSKRIYVTVEETARTRIFAVDV